jgi:hypothetical protein
MTIRDQLGDPMSDGASLSCAGAGKHTHGAAPSQHGFALLVVQPGGQRVSDHRHTLHLVSGGRQTARIATPPIAQPPTTRCYVDEP